MSNLGLERYLGGIGLTLERTQVGDRYVVEHMREHGFNLGGEQSGHIVMSDHATTGDGLLAALQTLAALAATGRRTSGMTRLFEPLPQVLRNVRVADTGALESAGTKAAIAEGHARLGKHGRLLVRASGTEPVIRVMAEGDDEALVSAVVEDVAQAVIAAAEADDPEERTSAAAQ